MLVLLRLAVEGWCWTLNTVAPLRLEADLSALNLMEKIRQGALQVTSVLTT
jgi:hypothetical protein